MRKILIILPLIVFLGCTKHNSKVVYSPSFKDDPVRNQMIEDDRLTHYERWTKEERNHWLDSMNALGVGIVVKGADRTYDTIINHIQYFYTTDK